MPFGFLNFLVLFVLLLPLFMSYAYYFNFPSLYSILCTFPPTLSLLLSPFCISVRFIYLLYFLQFIFRFFHFFLLHCTFLFLIHSFSPIHVIHLLPFNFHLEKRKKFSSYYFHFQWFSLLVSFFFTLRSILSSSFFYFFYFPFRLVAYCLIHFFLPFRCLFNLSSSSWIHFSSSIPFSFLVFRSSPLYYPFPDTFVHSKFRFIRCPRSFPLLLAGLLPSLILTHFASLSSSPADFFLSRSSSFARNLFFIFFSFHLRPLILITSSSRRQTFIFDKFMTIFKVVLDL